jgi:aromatic-L-amino-acid decarboxylase
MDILKRAFSLVPEYLKTPEGDVKNFMDYGIQLGRRFRGLKLWFVIRSFGVEGLRVNIREHCRLAKEFAQWIDNDSQFERLAPVPFSVVCFRYHPSGIDDEQILEAINEKLIQRVNATGEIFISHTKLNGKFTIRVAIGHLRTTERHLRRVWELLKEFSVNL